MNIDCFAIDRLISHVDPYHTRWYSKTCGHKVSHSVDNDTCLQNYDEKGNCKWMECQFSKNGLMKNVFTRFEQIQFA